MKADHPSWVQFAATSLYSAHALARECSRWGDSGIITAGGWDERARACWWLLKPHWFFPPPDPSCPALSTLTLGHKQMAVGPA